MSMRRLLLSEKLLVCGVLPFSMWINEEKTENAYKIFDRNCNTFDGKQQIYRIFSLDSSGSFSPELTKTCQATAFGAVLGGLYGGYRIAKPSPEVIERNKTIGLTTKFEERNKKAIESGKDFVARYCKEGFHWGWRVGILCGSLTLLTSVIPAYRGCSGIFEYTVAGAITGICVSWKRGAKTMGATGLIGTGLGTLFGCAAYVGNTISGTTTEQNNFWKYGWEEAQLKPSTENVRKLREESRKYVQSEVAQSTNDFKKTS